MHELMGRETNGNAPQHFSPFRVKVLYLCISLCFLILTIRLADIQIINHTMLEHQADLRSLRTMTIATVRGTITDRDGKPMAVSVPTKNIVADPVKIINLSHNMNSPGWHKLSSLLDTSLEKLQRTILTHQNKKFIVIKRNVDFQTANVIANLHLFGISEQLAERRFYPQREIAASLIGLVGAENYGLAGLEDTFNKVLEGESGEKKVRLDSDGHPVSVSEYAEPQQATNVQLSIDSYDQFSAYNAIKMGVIQNKATSGAAVLVSVDTGEILAMVSYPSFNPNNLSDLTSSGMRDIPVNDSFEPGSTVKPFVVLAGLENHIIQPDSLLITIPYRVNGHVIRDVGRWDKLSITGILQKSSDIGVSHIALAMPAAVLVSMYNSFGFGKDTRLGLPGESVGYFPLHRHSWSDIERATFSFGYGLRVTPLQIARAYATLGDNGIYKNLSITKVTPPVEGTRVADPEMTKIVLHMMESDVLPGGTGVKAVVPGYCLATKTGTAEKLGKDGKYNAGYINYMAGVAPATHPLVALVVVINNPTAGTHYGGTVAAPVFGNILKSVLPHLNARPDCMK